MFADKKKKFLKRKWKKKIEDFKMSFVERNVTTTLKCKKKTDFLYFFRLMRNKNYLRRTWTKELSFLFVSRKKKLRMLHWTEFFDKIIKIISIYWVLKLFKFFFFFFFLIWNGFIWNIMILVRFDKLKMVGVHLLSKENFCRLKLKTMTTRLRPFPHK